MNIQDTFMQIWFHETAKTTERMKQMAYQSVIKQCTHAEIDRNNKLARENTGWASEPWHTNCFHSDGGATETDRELRAGKAGLE